MKAFAIVAAVFVCVSSLGCAAATPGARVAKPVSIEGEHPLTVRTDAGNLWVGAHVWGDTRRAWEKPSHGSIEEMTIRPVDGGHEITFVQGGLRWRGEVDADHKARGPLQLVPELGERSIAGHSPARTAGNP